MKIKENSKKEKFSIDISRNFLVTVFNSLFSENTLIDRRLIEKIKKFFGILNEEDFQSNQEKVILLDWIFLYLKSYFEKEFRVHEHIIEYILTNTQFKEELKEYLASEEAVETSNEDLKYLDHFLTLRLQWSYLYADGMQLKESLEKIEYNEFDNFEEIIERTNGLIENLYYKNQLTKYKLEDGKHDFSIKNRVDLNIALERSHTNILNPRSTIKTGLSTLNQLLNGGFQAGRSYCILTLPGCWKSGFLLNTAMWAVKYNKDLVAKDPTKIPTVLMLSLENSANETIERIASYLSSDTVGADLSKYSLKELQDLVQNSDIYQSNVDFVFLYRRSNSISTGGIESLILEIENTPVILEDGSQGFREIVFLVVDYLGRLLPNSGKDNAEIFVKIGNISTEITNYAKVHQIPLVSAHQLNRDADKRLEGVDETKLKGLKLGRQHVAGARDIIDNFDDIMIIFPEDKLIDNQKYLLINFLKHRGMNSGMNKYFYQPFENDMRLVEDIHATKPAAVTDLESLTGTVVEFKKERKKKNLSDNIRTIEENFDQDFLKEVE
jgi:hypothetical protein